MLKPAIARGDTHTRTCTDTHTYTCIPLTMGPFHCRYPSDATLNRIFLEHYQWKLFKKLTVIDALDRQNGCLYATKAATKKGTSGAAVFPGSQRKQTALPRQAECLFCTNEVQLSPAEEEEARHFLPRLT